MKIVVVGNGKVGNNLAGQLSVEGHDVVVIDKNINALKKSESDLDVIFIEGNGVDYKVQKDAGVDVADLLIAATSADEVNILCCLVAKKLGAKNTIARIRNPEYSDQLYYLEKDLGLSMSINPELAAAMEISRILQFPSVSKIDSFAGGKVELIEVKIGEKNPLKDVKIKDIKVRSLPRFLICAVDREGEVYIPTGDFELRFGDKIFVAVESHQINNFFRGMGMMHNKVKTVLIVGGGRLTYYLAKQLISNNMKVSIIEKKEDRCRFLCEEIPQARIIFGDGTDEAVLEANGIREVDAFVALTDIDEENLVISMYATFKGKPKVITKINRISYMEVFSQTSIDTVISPKAITSEQIIRYVRAMDNTLGSKVKALYKIAGNKAEALEFTADETTRYLERPISELPIKKNVLMVCIGRKNKILIPRGDTSIKKRDSVVLITKGEIITDINDIFSY